MKNAAYVDAKADIKEVADAFVYLKDVRDPVSYGTMLGTIEGALESVARSVTCARAKKIGGYAPGDGWAGRGYDAFPGVLAKAQNAFARLCENAAVDEHPSVKVTETLYEIYAAFEPEISLDRQDWLEEIASADCTRGEEAILSIVGTFRSYEFAKKVCPEAFAGNCDIPALAYRGERPERMMN